MSHFPRTGAPGFVLILMMATLAILLGVMVLQNQVLELGFPRAVEDPHDAHARELATRCLHRARRLAEAHLERGEPDLDLVLDPGGGPAPDGDEHVPPPERWPGGRIVTWPSSAKDLPPEAAAAHRYLLAREAGGACLVRYDDNLDDFERGPASTTSNTGGVLEGPAPDSTSTGPARDGAPRDVPWRDTDRVLTVTAIGLYPVPPGTPDGAVAAAARSRVTLRSRLELVWPARPLEVQP